MHQWDGPFLQSLRQYSVVGVSKGLGDNVPCLIPIKTLQIDQDALQLDNGQSRMGVVELDSHLVWEG